MTEFKYKSEVIGKNGISARIVAKSKSAHNGTIIPTWEYDAPKCILAELNTHGMLVKNAQSSRAVPVKKVIEQIRSGPVTPVHWGGNQAGMVAGKEIDTPITFSALWQGQDAFEKDTSDAWEYTAGKVADLMESWEIAGYHKQIVNRIGEAFTMVRGVITGTEIDNFFHLRYHPHADPYIQELARCMWEAYELAETEVLHEGEWHTPYVEHCRGEDEGALLEYHHNGLGIDLERAKQVSAAACGQVSYRKLDLSQETVERVWDRLMSGDIIHASVTGHQATPMRCYELSDNCGITKGVTHVDVEDGTFWSAQFKGWIMHRKLIPNESFKGKFVVPKQENS